MKKTDFYYDLTEELIAQSPVEPRDSSRLMKTDKESGHVTHSRFFMLADYLNEGDLLVLNDSRVFPARLLADGCEVLLLEEKGDYTWECIGTKLKTGRKINFGFGVAGEIVDILPDGNRLIRFNYDPCESFTALLEKIGRMPLPPYITQELEDSSRYNTVYAAETGSAAAPTAGLHFTDRVFATLAEKGVETAYVTLHVGLGTFRPVKAENINEHVMHSERYYVPARTAEAVRECRERGGRVIAVGTTACRTLEASNGTAGSGNTDIFIRPGYEFKLIDGLLTNFHLPESTLIMLVSAFLGREKTIAAYEAAIREKYRFFSFGDCMLIL